MTATDDLLTLSDALVTALNALAETLGSEGTPAFAASWQADALADLEDAALLDPQVWVIDVSEGFQSLGRGEGVVVCEWELLLVVQKKIDRSQETLAAATREMSALASEITRSCRRTVLDAAGGAACFSTERKFARDFKQLHEASLYRAEIATHWRVTWDEEG